MDSSIGIPFRWAICLPEGSEAELAVVAIPNRCKADRDAPARKDEDTTINQKVKKLFLVLFDEGG